MWLLLACLSPSEPTPENNPVSIDPLIATGGPGFRVGSSTPAATLPFGMLKVGPDTTPENGWISAYHCSGYYYDDDYILGFGHLHMHGTGVPGYGQLRVMPVPTPPPENFGESDYRAHFSHAQEEASPGRYAVTFDNGIRAEMVSTRHVALHHDELPPEGVVVLDLSAVLDGEPVAGALRFEENHFSGFTWTAGPFVGMGFPLYFYGEVGGGIQSFASGADGPVVEGQSQAEGVSVKGWFKPVNQKVDFSVGISRVSEEAARANWEAEVLSVEEGRKEAENAWDALLSRVQVRGGTAAQNTIFWTSLYHALQMPNEQAETDGSYLGFDGKVHENPGFVYSSDMSLWDTYRTAHSLYDLLYPEKARDFAGSLLKMAQEGGAFPRWPVANGEGGSMLGSPADIVMAETAIKGIGGWDVDAAWTLLREQALGKSVPYNGRPDPFLIQHFGYYPLEALGASVAWTQEVAWADAALSQMAYERGEAQDAAFFYQRSLSYRNLYDPSVGFFHARHASGEFKADFGDTQWLEEYTEGNAWQYLWLAPHDAEGLAELLGGREQARERLEFFFEGMEAEGVMALPQTYYWHGNEPDLHAAYLFALWGDPDRTVHWVRWIQQNLYGTGPDGLAGNDDGGTLSAWYIFSSLGLYPIAGTDRYVLTIPLFEEAQLQLPDGVFTIRREGEGEHFVGAFLDGAPIVGPVLRHSQIRGGSTLLIRAE